MRLRTLLIGGVAVIFGGSAAVGAYLLAKPSSTGSEIKTVAIVVAAADAPRGRTLTTEMLALKAWPEDYVPETALRTIEEAAGRAVSIPLVKGEAVTDAKLAARGAGRGMAAMIPSGMRAVTLQTPSVSTAMAGFILPGNKVDVLLTVSASRDQGASSVLLLQNVEVLAVDQHIEAPSENVVTASGMQSVTLLVTPAEAARLDLGQSRGTLRLALRNPSDGAINEVQPARLSNLQPDRDSPSLEEPPAQESPAQESPAEAVEPVTVQQTAAEMPAAPASVLLPVRTLRGSSSGILYLRRPAARQAAVASHAAEPPAEAQVPL